MCRRSPTHFINNWVDTFDPRVEPCHLPFSLYEFQEDLIEWITERYRTRTNGLLEKSRDMGATWCVVGWAVHSWLFKKGFVCRFGSRKEDLVDDGTLDSIFGKIRYVIERLPYFLKPKMKEKVDDTVLYIRHPTNHNQFVGESTNVGFGRGGRSSIVFLDEFAHVDHSEMVWASVKGNADCIIPLSSVNGKGNQFSYLRHETPMHIKSLHWSLHPKKSREWYEKEAAEMQPWQVAQELDISYERSKFGRIYRRFDTKWHLSNEIIQYKPEFEQAVSWDFGRAGMMAMLWLQIGPDNVTEVWNCFELSGWDIKFFLPIAKGEKPLEYQILDAPDRMKLDRVLAKIPPGYLWENVTHYGDHAGTAKTANSTRSCKDQIQAPPYGWTFKSSGKQGYDWRFECLDELLKMRYNVRTGKFTTKFLVSPDCKRFQDCMNNATWDSDNIHSDKINPKTDEFFHMVSAAEFFATNRFPVEKRSEGRSQTWR